MSDGRSRLVNQNDCRTSDLVALRAHGPVDLHWIQYSGAIWYPMVYEETPETMRELVDLKVESQLTRAMRYVEAVGARATVPSAGPPAFLDPELFGLNRIDGDELNIFPDQRVFMDRLARGGHEGILAIPGTTIEIRPDGFEVTHPMSETDVAAIFEHKREYLEKYQADYLPWLDAMKAGWTAHSDDLLGTVQAWWEPLLAMAPTLRRGGRQRACARGRRHPHRLPERPGACLARRALRLPVRHPARTRRDRGRPEGRRLEQLTVPQCALPGVAQGQLQRVRLQLLQVVVGRAHAPHRGRGAAQGRPRAQRHGRRGDPHR
ncbi:MAG: hypothetical protein R2713_10730 [Ilumatobacteraceae bacterium]